MADLYEHRACSSCQIHSRLSTKPAPMPKLLAAVSCCCYELKSAPVAQGCRALRNRNGHAAAQGAAGDGWGPPWGAAAAPPQGRAAALRGGQRDSGQREIRRRLEQPLLLLVVWRLARPLAGLLAHAPLLLLLLLLMVVLLLLVRVLQGGHLVRRHLPGLRWHRNGHLQMAHMAAADSCAFPRRYERVPCSQLWQQQCGVDMARISRFQILQAAVLPGGLTRAACCCAAAAAAKAPSTAESMCMPCSGSPPICSAASAASGVPPVAEPMAMLTTS